MYVCEQLQLPMQPRKVKSGLVNGEEFPIFEFYSDLLIMNSFYETMSSVVSHLI